MNTSSTPTPVPPPASNSRRLDLRGFSEEERNARVNVHIAQIAGWTVASDCRTMRRLAGESAHKVKGAPPDFGQRPDGEYDHIQPYATSADAVLPLLNHYQWQLTRWNGGRALTPAQYWVNLPMGEPNSAEGEADTFPLAACFALLRAHGFEILT